MKRKLEFLSVTSAVTTSFQLPGYTHGVTSMAVPEASRGREHQTQYSAVQAMLNKEVSFEKVMTTNQRQKSWKLCARLMGCPYVVSAN